MSAVIDKPGTLNGVLHDVDCAVFHTPANTANRNSCSCGAVSKALRKALLKVGTQLDNIRHEVGCAVDDGKIEINGERSMRDAYELIMVLARILDGQSVYKAFGAPGDWGYETPIGNALAVLYREQFSQLPSMRLSILSKAA